MNQHFAYAKPRGALPFLRHVAQVLQNAHLEEAAQAQGCPDGVRQLVRTWENKRKRTKSHYDQLSSR